MGGRIEQSVSAGPGSNINQATGNISITNIYLNAPKELIDKFILEKVDKLIRCRFFSEYDRIT